MASYVSLENLQLYDEKLKAKISADDSVVLQSSKDYADSLAVNYATATQGAIAEANAQAIVELQAGLDAVEDIYVNPDADNKYNAINNVIELYLNNAKYEQVFRHPYGNLSLTSTAIYGGIYSVVDGEDNPIAEEDFEDKIAEGDAYGFDFGGFEDCYPNLRVVYISNGDGTYTEHQLPPNEDSCAVASDIATLIDSGKEVFIKAEATKVEVDMSDLVAKIDAIESATSEDIENLFV